MIVKYYVCSYTFADLTVFIIRPAILYGSPFDAGLRSSSQPFQPFSTAIIGMRIEAPLSDIPQEKSVMAAVSCKPVKRWSLNSP